jgi:large subunit ribosomal protein L2
LAKLQYKTENVKEAYSYIIAPKGLKMFDTIQTIKERRRNLLLRPGDATILYNFESGDFIHNVELFPGSGAKIARSAGTSSQILQYASKDYAKIRLPSGSQRLISLNAMAVLGIIANENHNRIIIGKAGRNR